MSISTTEFAGSRLGTPLGSRSRPLALCYGTRPQVIKAAALARVLRGQCELVTIDTGQHYDYELNGLLYHQLEIEPPTFCLDVREGNGSAQVAAILSGAGRVFSSIGPRAVIVIGDTNSTVGCALAAAQLGIPLIHVEAGLRSGDLRMVEEVNRRMVDAVAAVLCAPTQRAADALSAETVPGTVHVTGDIAYDALLHAWPRVPAAERVPALEVFVGAPFVLATLHRSGLVEQPHLLAAAIDALSALEQPVVFAAHPRTRRALQRNGLERRLGTSVRVVPPLGYLEALAAVAAAAAVVTDSGGVQREAYWLGTPCITLRSETEWVETIEAGANRLVPPADARSCLADAVRQTERAAPSRGGWPRQALGDGAAAHRIAAVLDATTGRHL